MSTQLALGQYLVWIATDSNAYADFLRDPIAASRNFLSEQDIAILNSLDPEALYARLVTQAPVPTGFGPATGGQPVAATQPPIIHCSQTLAQLWAEATLIETIRP
jgi:hypothetical protein